MRRFANPFLLLIASWLLIGAAPSGGQSANEEPWPAACAAEAARTERVHGEIKMPVCIRRSEPVTDPKRWNLKCPDLLPMIELIVRPDGSVSCARIIRITRGKPPAGLYDAVRATVQTWKFRPATLHGKPLQVTIVYSVDYMCN